MRATCAVAVASLFLAFCAAAADRPFAGPVFMTIADVDAPNLIANGDFETGDAAPLAPAAFYHNGYTLAPGEGTDGSRAIKCVNARPDDFSGACVTLILNQDKPRPIIVGGSSKALDVSGSSNIDYSIYCDLIYSDGTPLWGQIMPFETGTHDWQNVSFVIYPQKPVAKLLLHALFRNHSGTVWFDDLFASELDDAATFDLQGIAGSIKPRAPGRSETEMRTGDGLTLGFDGNGRVASFNLGGNDVLRKDSFGGFFAKDCAAGSDFLPFSGKCVQNNSGVAFTGGNNTLSLNLKADMIAHENRLEVAGMIQDTTGNDRAVTLYFALPVKASGWKWCNDMTRAEDIGQAGSYQNVIRCEAGASGSMSFYPMGCVAPPEKPSGLALAWPISDPRLSRIGYHAATGTFYIAFDLGLTKNYAKSPSAASFKFIIYAFDSEWGWRAAWAKYMTVYPDDFVKRVDREGIWMAFQKISSVERHDDFGFAFKEGEEETAWDDAHDILTFRYTEPQSFWCKISKDADRSYAGCIAEMEKQAKEGNALARATLTSAVHSPHGNYDLSVADAPWCVGAVFSLNPSPFIPGDVTKAKVNYTTEDADKRYADSSKGILDGEYLDSLEGWAVLNYRPEHIACADIPPVFDSAGRVCLMNMFSIWEFSRFISKDVHKRGKLMMANSVPWRFPFLMGWFDLTGTETDWKPGGLLYAANTEEIMNARRACSGQKPYLLLQNTDFTKWTHEDTERYMKRCLHYAVFPSFFSANAATEHYFAQPKLYNRDRALFKKYIPLIQTISKAGWQPIPHAKCDDPNMRIERYGPAADGKVYLSVLNLAGKPMTAKIAVDAAAAGIPGDARSFRSLLTEDRISASAQDKGIIFEISIGSGETTLLIAE
ncbi:MAG TPA: hypothetical protein PL033_15975 [Candidatus Brocadiia bacterium]|nr:hypothetical protein [Candidatus Brocadiia bacterium]